MKETYLRSDIAQFILHGITSVNDSIIDQVKLLGTQEDGIYLVQVFEDREEFYKEVPNHYKWIMDAVDLLHIYDDNGIHNFDKVQNKAGEGIVVYWNDSKNRLYLVNATMD